MIVSKWFLVPVAGLVIALTPIHVKAVSSIDSRPHLLLLSQADGETSGDQKLAETEKPKKKNESEDTEKVDGKTCKPVKQPNFNGCGCHIGFSCPEKRGEFICQPNGCN